MKDGFSGHFFLILEINSFLVCCCYEWPNAPCGPYTWPMLTANSI